MFHQVRKYLLMLDSRKDHVKFWRPQILLLVNNPRYNCNLIKFVNFLKKSGLYIIGHVHVGDLDTLEGPDPSVSEIRHWQTLIDHLEVKAFPEVTVAKSIREGLQQLARISGLGAMKPNTILIPMMNFGHDPKPTVDYFGDENSKFYKEDLKHLFSNKTVTSDDETEDFDEDLTNQNLELMKTVSDMIKLDKNVCLTRNFDNFEYKSKKYLDVWLIDFFDKPNQEVSDPGQSFMLQLAVILKMQEDMKNLKIRVFVRVMEERLEIEMRKKLERMLYGLRIVATVHILSFHRAYTLLEVRGIHSNP